MLNRGSRSTLRPSAPARAALAPKYPRATGANEASRYLALEDASHMLAVSIAGVRRILAYSGGALAGDASDVVEVDGEVIPVIELRRWFGWQGPRLPVRRMVVIDDPRRAYGVLVDRALSVFSATPDELRSAGGLGDATANGVVAFCPWSKLADYLVRGAVPANVLARAMIQRSGKLSSDGERLWAGDTLLNLNEAIVDGVLEATGYGCTIFLGNVRIATTATTTGSHARAVGTQADPAVTTSTLKRGVEYRGVTRTLGKDWAIVYHPLRDERRGVVGMVSTFRELSSRLLPVIDLGAVRDALALPGAQR